MGPAILFEHDPVSIRLDHYLAQQKDKLSVDTHLDLVRQLAEVVKFRTRKKSFTEPSARKVFLSSNLSPLVLG